MSEALRLASPPAIVQQAEQQLLELDQRVDQAEGDGLRARWEFGRELARKRVGAKLPAGLLEQLATNLGKEHEPFATEAQRRMRFAERYPDETAFRHAMTEYGSWFRVVNEGLSTGIGVHGSSDRHDWETPQDLFDELDAEFGFDLDVCATAETAKCRRYFTPTDDGLAQEWSGTCWMNPPYGDAIGTWIEKAHASAEAGATVVCLVPARVDTAWWWTWCRYGEVRFLRGRLRFGDGDTGAPFPSALIIFGRPANILEAHWDRAA